MFAYSCIIKIHAPGFSKLLENIFCFLLVVAAFFCKKLWRCFKKWQSVDERSGEYGGQNKILQLSLSNFRNIGCVTCGQALSWRRIGPFLLISAGCRHCSFQCISSICWAYLSDVMVLLGFRGLQWIKQAADYQRMTGHYPSFGASFVLGTALELLRRKKWQPTPVHLPGKPHEQRSLVGYSP